MALAPDKVSEAQRTAESAANQLPKSGTVFASGDIERSYLMGQARAMGLTEPVDPSRANGERIIDPIDPKQSSYGYELRGLDERVRGNYGISVPDGDRYWVREENWATYRSTLPNALASAQKHDLAGVPFN